MSKHLLIVTFILFSWDYQRSSTKHHADAVSAVPTDVHVGYENNLLNKQDNDQLEQLTTNTKEELTFEKLYAQGIRAYEQSMWYSCANSLEKAIKDYKAYEQVLSKCRLDCSKGVKVSKLSNITTSIHDFSHFVKILKDADCFRRCKDESLSIHPRLTSNLEDDFEKRVPYQYLQFCYFKLDRLSEAASAAYTYYLANPDGEDTKENVVYYRDQAMVPETEFIDLELVPYKEHYIRGTIAYTKSDWKSVITELEASLEDYFKQYEQCLSDCPAKVKTKGKEFNTEVADMIIGILMCRLNCEERLSIVYMEPIRFFLQDIYHYLQFAYYKEENLEKSVELTASFLVLNSSHAIMKDNKELLKVKLQYSDDDFIPRKDVVNYATGRREMHELMDLLNKDYRWPAESDVSEESSDEESEVTEQNIKATDDWMTKYEKLGVHIIAKSEDLHREARFVADGLLKDEQCEQLRTLAKDLKIEEFGSQKFDLEIAQQRLEENPDEEYETVLRLFIRATEIVSHYTQRDLGADVPLYLKDAQIVCWSQLDDPEKILNCYAQEDGTCVQFDKTPSSRISESYMTATYLNTVDGGDFQFLNENKDVDSSFGAKCGRTVGFKIGDLHAVKVPRKDDKRCAMVIRFVNDSNDDDMVYKDTIGKLHRVEELRFASMVKNRLSVMKKFEEEGVKIVKNGDDLMGRERFVADGLASEVQCSTLKNMVQSIKIYSESQHPSSRLTFKSPHTEHEMYHVITIYRAAKLTHDGLISTFGLRTFLDLSEKSRILVEKYFNLTKPLYFDFTHLVCRTAVDDTKTNREDLSHPVHADNCILQPNGSCVKDFPAFTQRDYSAILYLNADFEGGEFFFAHSNKSEQVSLRPKCGRLVGFNAGEFHGVRAVESGQRCAMALWFTFNNDFKEVSHIHARKALKRLEEEQRAEEEQIAEEKAAHEDL